MFEFVLCSSCLHTSLNVKYCESNLFISVYHNTPFYHLILALVAALKIVKLEDAIFNEEIFLKIKKI